MGFLEDELSKVERRLIKEALAKQRDAERAAAKLGITVRELGERARRLHIPLVIVRRRRKKRIKEVRPLSALRKATHELERRWMREALDSTGGDVKAAASLINMPRSRFYARLREFQINVVVRAEPTGRKAKPRDIKAAIRKLETRLFNEAVKESDGDLSQAARALGISRSTLFRWRRDAKT